MSSPDTWDAARTERRRLEELLRTDCARLEREGYDPQDILISLRATAEFWRGELQDIASE